MENTRNKFNWFQIISLVLIVLLTAEVLLLIKQNRELKETLKSMTMVAEVDPLKPGDRVESFKIQTLDGSASVLEYTDTAKKYLLFVLSTTCPHCEKTLPVWKSIAKANGNSCDIFGISIHNIEDTKKFLASKDVGFYTVSAMNDTSFNRKYRISGVPETILINGNGVVEKAWVGELSDEQSKEIQILMSVKSSSL